MAPLATSTWHSQRWDRALITIHDIYIRALRRKRFYCYIHWSDLDGLSEAEVADLAQHIRETASLNVVVDTPEYAAQCRWRGKRLIKMSW